MRQPTSTVKQTRGLSRRTLIKSVAAAAAMGLPSSSEAMLLPATPVDYGPGKTDLVETTVFPLLAAWLMITTSAPSIDAFDQKVMTCVAKIGGSTASDVLGKYTANQTEFDIVRGAFAVLAKKYASNTSPYNGGQCPDDVNTLTPIAALYGTATVDNCKVKGKKPRKK
jgi:hypothetical protein